MDARRSSGVLGGGARRGRCGGSFRGRRRGLGRRACPGKQNFTIRPFCCRRVQGAVMSVVGTYEGNPQMNRPVREEPVHEAALGRHHARVLLVCLLFLLRFREGSSIGAWRSAASGDARSVGWGVKFGGFLKDVGFVGAFTGREVQVPTPWKEKQVRASREEEMGDCRRH